MEYDIAIKSHVGEKVRHGEMTMAYSGTKQCVQSALSGGQGSGTICRNNTGEKTQMLRGNYHYLAGICVIFTCSLG